MVVRPLVYRILENKIIHFTKERRGCIDDPRAANRTMYFTKAASGQEVAHDNCNRHAL